MTVKPRQLRTPKKPYETPKLVLYGHARSLTLGGSGMMQEGQGMMNPNRYP